MTVFCLNPQVAVFPDVTPRKPATVTMPIGTPSNYTITVDNPGGAIAPNTVLVEVLPPGLLF
jgi:uncharacterized repeat protein (TIGR01451 family)